MLISAEFGFVSINPVLLARISWFLNFVFDKMFAAFRTPISKWCALQIQLPSFELNLSLLIDSEVDPDLKVGSIEVSGFT